MLKRMPFPLLAALLLCLALSGGLGAGADKLYGYGVTSMMTAVDGPMPLQEALARAEELYRDAALRMFRILQVGRQLT